MRLVFEQIRTGGDRNFGYLLGDRDAKLAVLIDPSYSPDTLVARAQEQGLQITHVINTHGHPDHVNGNARAVDLTAAPVAAHRLLSAPVDIALADGEELVIGALRMRFLHAPGHSADHLVIHERSYGLAITGDLLFVGKVGGTQSDADARVEWESLQRVLEMVPDETTVWPGHDYGVRPSSTIGIERTTNPFLLCGNVEAFLALKQDWAAFKAKNGLK
jgi:glyoxylase-like metal-dependent hydrolase (beta-lactamase superfamily II)